MKEEQQAVASRFSLTYWTFLLVLSGALIALTEDPTAALVWVLFMLFLSISATGFRIQTFLKRANDLLHKGQVTSPYDLRKQHKLVILLMLLTAAAFFAPLLLSAALNSSTWIGSLLGVIDGWILGLLLYNAYLSYWQKKNNGELFILETWNGNKITHKGLAFSKRGNKSN